MREIEMKTWILSFDEFRILLASLGYASVDGIFMEEKQFTRSDVIQSLFRLQNGECIMADAEAFSLDTELETMLRTVGEPDGTEVLEADNGRQVFCYYKGEYVTVSERYYEKKDTIRLYGFTLEAFALWRKENFSDDSGAGECALY